MLGFLKKKKKKRLLNQIIDSGITDSEGVVKRQKVTSLSNVSEGERTGGGKKIEVSHRGDGSHGCP